MKKCIFGFLFALYLVSCTQSDSTHIVDVHEQTLQMLAQDKDYLRQRLPDPNPDTMKSRAKTLYRGADPH